MTAPSPLEVDGDRLVRRLAALATIGARPQGGVTRLAYSAEDVAGRELVAGWMREAGLTVTLDAAANLVGRTPGDGPALVIGSHLDTVVAAGALDGAYGVVAGVEVAAAARTAGGLRHPLAVVAFANEEGARGTPAFAGSLAIAGTPPPLDHRGVDGRALGELLAEAGGRPDELAGAAWPAGSVAHYLELHIEQGPVLDAEGLVIGAVTGITGRQGLDVVITGAANHAGTTPMDRRADASVAAAHVVLAGHDLAAAGALRVATAGYVQLTPNVVNVVPGAARVGLDLRDLDDARVVAAHAELEVRLAEIAAATGTTIAVNPGERRPAALTDPATVDTILAIAAGLGLPAVALPSGAGHDAQVMAGLGPVSMIFVPSVGGVSHSPLERTEPRHLVAGAEVLARTVAHLDARLP